MPKRAQIAEANPSAISGTSLSRSRSGGTAICVDVEPVVEVLAESSGRHLRVEVAVRRRHDPRVHGQQAGRADPGHMALLEHAEQLGLRRERQLADLIEEQRAALGRLERALPGDDGRR